MLHAAFPGHGAFMAAWLIPALKAVLPHVGTIISTAAPVFTRKRDDAASQGLLQQQITELQAAASRNAANIRELAEQLQSTVAALEQAAAIADGKLRRAFLLCVIAAVLSAVSLGIALFVILAR
jgi:hypothetical protein